MTSILATILVFGLIVFVHELGHFITAKMTGMKVEEFAIGFGPKIAGIQKGETLYTVRAIPLGGFNKIAGMEMEDDSAGERSYWRKPIWARMIVIFAGSFMNFLLPVFLFAGSLFFYGISKPSPEPVIGNVVVDSPAERAGLVAGDKILTIDGRKITNWYEISDDFKDKDGRSVQMRIERAGEVKELQVFPRLDDNGERAVIGITQSGTITKVSLGESVVLGGKIVLNIIGKMYYGLLEMITGHAKAELSGPIGVAQMTSQYAKLGLEALIGFAAILSINLGVINLLPIPGLDGGHMVMLFIEAVRRKPLPSSVLKRIQAVGVTLLLALMIFATTKDIFRIFG